MAFERAVTSLQHLEDKLRRYLGLAGKIDPQWAPTLTPVLMIGTLDDPGVASFRGRHFAVSSGIISDAVTKIIAWQFKVAVIIRFVHAHGVNVSGELYTLAPDETDPAAILTNGVGTWIDQKVTGTDRCPIDTTGFVVRTGPDVSDTNRIATLSTGAADFLDRELNMHIPADGWLVFKAVGGFGSGMVDFNGQIF